jgi:dimethylamine/trimethylamine dehydrogenase
MGVGMAEQLARDGKQVVYATPFEAIGAYTHYTLENPRLNRTLRQCGVRIVTEHLLTNVEPGVVTLMEAWDESTHELECDSVVLVTQRRSEDRIYHELKSDPDALVSAGIGGLYRIGDCEVPQIIADAIFSGHRLAREIDSPNPAVPRPYIRERRLLGATEEDYHLDSRTIGAAAAAEAR